VITVIIYRSSLLVAKQTSGAFWIGIHVNTLYANGYQEKNTETTVTLFLLFWV